MFIYYDSKTGNVHRFTKKMQSQRPDWHFIKINPTMVIKNEGHLLTFTTKIGEIPATTEEFLQNENNSKLLKSVSSSGNRNWGQFFALAADKIQEKYGIPVLMKFELSGTSTEVENYIKYLENRACLKTIEMMNF